MQIEHIFSDKTGTLTQNKMTFRFSCIGRGELFAAEVNLGQKVKVCSLLRVLCVYV